jgi:hypothetical protein
MISHFGVGGFPPFRQEKGERMGHGLVQKHTVRALVDCSARMGRGAHCSRDTLEGGMIAKVVDDFYIGHFPINLLGPLMYSLPRS